MKNCRKEGTMFACSVQFLECEFTRPCTPSVEISDKRLREILRNEASIQERIGLFATSTSVLQWWKLLEIIVRSMEGDANVGLLQQWPNTF